MSEDRVVQESRPLKCQIKLAREMWCIQLVYRRSCLFWTHYQQQPMAFIYFVNIPRAQDVAKSEIRISRRHRTGDGEGPIKIVCL